MRPTMPQPRSSRAPAHLQQKLLNFNILNGFNNLFAFSALLCILLIITAPLADASFDFESVKLDGDFLGFIRHIQRSVRTKRANIPCGASFPCSQRPTGITAPFISNNQDQSLSSNSEEPQFVTAPSIRFKMVQLAAQEAKDEIDRMFNQTEPFLKYSDTSATEKLWSTYRGSFDYAKDLSYSALISIGTSQRLRSFGLQADEILFGLPKMDLEGTLINEVCPPNPIQDCVPGRYRVYSGHCNNVNNPLWGASYEPLQRFLTADYADQVSDPRSSQSGSPLPNARDVSQAVFTPALSDHQKCTLMLMHWAQFVYNDLVHLGEVKGHGRNSLACCDSTAPRHPECFPVNVTSPGNSFHRTVGCYSYARTNPAPKENCLLGPREQMNMATSLLDASSVYGSTQKRATDLRSYDEGRLRVQTVVFGKDLLIADFFDKDRCKGSQSTPCFLSGSDHVNSNLGLASLHTVWLRQHNRIVELMQERNPHWEEARLYHETRRVIEAQIQHITFNEFLPIIIGVEGIQKYGLALQRDGYYSDYALNVNPSALNSYAAAVGLFFYTLMPRDVIVYSKSKVKTIHKSIGDFWFDPSQLYIRDRLDGILRYMITDPIDNFDIHFTEELLSKFLATGSDPGYDLPAIILQMGRDHGIPSYTTWRHQCGLTKITKWSQLDDDVQDPAIIQTLQRLFETVEDVDLFLLGLAEKPLPGSLLGPTFACIMGFQFQKVRRGDRFWYENFFYPSAFTEDQLNEIRKTTLAGVLCENTDDIGEIQPYVMTMEDNFENCPISCNSSVIRRLDFQYWIDSEPKVHLPITQDTLQKAVRLGTETANEIEVREGRRVRLRDTQEVQPGDPIFAHAQLLSPKKESLDKARTAKILLETTKILIRGEGLNPEERLPRELDIGELQRLLPRIDVSQLLGNVSENNEECVPQPFPCDHTSPYRQYSGWCNNIRFPGYGNAFNPFRRLLDPAYNDGFDEPRIMATNDQPLPSPRLISNVVHQTVKTPHVKYTHMLMQFGQFLDHDLTHSPINTGPADTTLNCSMCDSHVSESINCFPIPIPSNDDFFTGSSGFGRDEKCLPFTRSLLGQLTLGYREQINQLSSFLDASNIYGSTECQANDLRLYSMGKLNFTDNADGLKEGLPQGFQEKDCRSMPVHMCFVAGDSRANEQTGLTAMHTIWLREHNRIATRLNRINNFWTDEKIFQETRRIVGAMLQHIAFNEFLPKVLGMETMAKYGLIPQNKGYFKDYDPHCDATVSNELATAAFRFGHSLIRDTFERMDDFFHNFSIPLQLRHMFMNVTPLHDAGNGGLDTIMLGLAGVASADFDRHISDEVRNHLFEKVGSPRSGMDLPAINIQRGRDHGLRPYNDYRQYCGLNKATSFNDLLDTSDRESVDALRRVYRDVDDIDLFPGIMTEKPLRGALVGPTAACILAEQFQRVRKCDRHWYENEFSGVRFTPDQLAELRKTTLAKVVCANSQFIRKIQPNIFDMQDELQNSQVACQDLPDIDLYEWLDRQFCIVDHRVINLGKAKRITPCVSCTCTSEGPECHSVTVKDCYRLLDEYLLQEVLGDTVCVIQCSAVIKRRTSGNARTLFNL